jgi:cytochrome b
MNEALTPEVKVTHVAHPVWDLPIRVFHWVLALCFVGAVVTQDGEKWRLFHVAFASTMFGLVVFRLLWGMTGSHHARFSNFLAGPKAILAYAKDFIAGKPAHFVGHNPLGALAIVAILGLVLVLGLTGFINYNDLAGDWVAELHEGAAKLLYAVVAVHIGGVALSSWQHRENLTRAMVTGKKAIPARAVVSGPNQSHSDHPWVALIMVVVIAGYWWWQFTS